MRCTESIGIILRPGLMPKRCDELHCWAIFFFGSFNLFVALSLVTRLAKQNGAMEAATTVTDIADGATK